MIRCTVIVACLAALLADAIPADAGRPRSRSRSTTRYPRVYGWTGTPYGPTQAHYQYRRQYGRPWHGYGGLNTSYRFSTPYGYARYHRNRYSSLYGRGLYGFGYTRAFLGLPYLSFGVNYGCYGAGVYNSVLYGSGFGYAPYYSTPYSPYSSYGPVLNYSTTVIPQTAPRVFDNGAVQQALRAHENRAGREIPVTIKRTGPSFQKAREHARRLLPDADEFLRKRDYRAAAARYHSAVLLDPEMAEAHFRLGYARAAQGSYEKAVVAFKKGLQLDPLWPTTGESLVEVFGQGNEEATANLVRKVTDWTKGNIRDPQRLFLLGVLLHFADRADSAKLLFTAARRQGDRGDHLTAFLNPIGGKPTQRRSVESPPEAKPDGVTRRARKSRTEQPRLLVPPLPRR